MPGRYFAALLLGAIHGASKEEILAAGYEAVPGLWESTPLAPRIAAGSFRKRHPPAIRGTGYVVDCLEAALWAFHRGESFRDGALLAVNLGDDADTTGAVFGQIAGACLGESGIPDECRTRIAMHDSIRGLADRLACRAADGSRTR